MACVESCNSSKILCLRARQYNKDLELGRMVTEADPHDNTAVLAKRVIVFNLQFPYVLNQINELYSLTNWSEYFQGIGIASQATLCLCSSQSIAIVFTARLKIRQILYLDGRGNKLV